MMLVHQVRFVTLGILTIAWFLVAGEALCRFEGNWRFDRLQLTKVTEFPPDQIQIRNSERALLQQTTYRKEVDPEWFFLSPARLMMPRNPELELRTAENHDEGGQQNFIWNDAWLAHPNADFVALIKRQKTSTLFAFPSYDGTPFPRFRLYPSTDFAPAPWATNRWGWFGADTGVRKPRKTIRVGIIGDSTSHNMYALNLQTYLDAWAIQRGIDLQFQVFSAGRQGLGFDDELAVLKYELGPMGLDYVYEYFAPRFSLNPPIMTSFSNLSSSRRPPTPSLQQSHTSVLVRTALARFFTVSALAAYLEEAVDDNSQQMILAEPTKPAVKLMLPPRPSKPADLVEVEKSSYFKELTAHLHAFKTAAEEIHAIPFASTEHLNVRDGMLLRASVNRHLFEVVNGPLFWPFTYADLRQMLAVHNATIRLWAKANAVTLVDIDGRFPARPELAFDPWHDNEFGQKLRAWVIFQAMLPRLERDIRTGQVPRPNGIDTDVHPYLDKPIERIDRKEWLSKVEKRSVLATPGK